MTLEIRADPVPLRQAEGDSVRVGHSRITLEHLLRTYLDGLSPNEIAAEWDTLELAEIHAAIAYYLRHRAEVDAYLRECEARAAAVERRIERDFPSEGTGERLLARRAAARRAS